MAEAVQTMEMEEAVCRHFDVGEAVNHDTGEEDYYGPLDENGEPYYNEKTRAILQAEFDQVDRIFGNRDHSQSAQL